MSFPSKWDNNNIWIFLVSPFQLLRAVSENKFSFVSIQNDLVTSQSVLLPNKRTRPAVQWNTNFISTVNDLHYQSSPASYLPKPRATLSFQCFRVSVSPTTFHWVTPPCFIFTYLPSLLPSFSLPQGSVPASALLGDWFKRKRWKNINLVKWILPVRFFKLLIGPWGTSLRWAQ